MEKNYHPPPKKLVVFFLNCVILFSFFFSKTMLFYSIFEFVRHVPVCSSCGFVAAGDEKWDASKKNSFEKKKKNGACEKVRHPPAKRKKIHQRLGPAVTRSTGCQKYDPGHSQGVNAHPTHLKKIVTTFFTTCEAVKPPTLGKSLTELQKDNTKAARHPTSPPERV